MNKQNHIDWCIVKLESDLNWWVREMSSTPSIEPDEKVSILDPKQVEFMQDLLEPLRPYGLRMEIVERAFIPFSIDKDLGGGQIRLAATKESFFSSEEKLFAMPNVFDEAYGGYAEFLDHVSLIRAKMLNDVCHFKQKLTIDELEEQVRDALAAQENGELPVHLFQEIVSVLEYCPAGYDEVLDDHGNDSNEQSTDSWPEEDGD